MQRPIIVLVWLKSPPEQRFLVLSNRSDICSALLAAGKVFLMAILDLPFSISPVVTGLMLVLLYGRNGWFAPALNAMGFNVVFAFPGALTFPFICQSCHDWSIPKGLGLSGRAAVPSSHVLLPQRQWGLACNVMIVQWGLSIG